MAAKPNQSTSRLIAVSGKDFLVIEEQRDGVYLFTHRARDGFIGDTWHSSIDDAKEQAVSSYGVKPDDWRAVPENERDAAAYARQKFNL